MVLEADRSAVPPPPPGDPVIPHSGSPAATQSASPPVTSPPTTLLPPGFLSCGPFPRLRSLLETARRRGTTPGALFVDLVLEHFHTPLCADLLLPPLHFYKLHHSGSR